MNDLVILKIIDGSFKSFENLPFLIKFQTVEKGSDVFTLGYPRTDIQGVETKVTKGNIVAQTGFNGDVGHYTISAPIDHGSSGGPLFDIDGNIIGITDMGLSIESSKQINENTPLSTSQFYALKASKISPMIDLLSDIQFTNQNIISNLPFTKKVKVLEKYVFIINTYINNDDQTRGRKIIKGEKRKLKIILPIGTKVNILRHGRDKMGYISKRTLTDKGYTYTIVYKKRNSYYTNPFVINEDDLTIIEENGKVIRVDIQK